MLRRRMVACLRSCAIKHDMDTFLMNAVYGGTDQPLGPLQAGSRRHDHWPQVALITTDLLGYFGWIEG